MHLHTEKKVFEGTQINFIYFLDNLHKIEGYKFA